MSEERKVMCPWCRDIEMGTEASQHPLNHQWTAYFMCGKCYAGTPNAYGSTREAAIAAAYAAATATPPNRPLTLEEFKERNDPSYIAILADNYSVGECFDNTWVFDYSSAISYAVRVSSQGYDEEGREILLTEQSGMDEEYGDCWIAFASRPTPADIAAARARKGEEHAD